MTTNKAKTTYGLIIMMVLFLMVPNQAKAATETEITLANVGGNAVATLLRGVLEGKVKNLKDAGKMLLYGGAAGYGFYQSKKLVANGNTFAGVMLANISASVTENTAVGNHPLSHIGYSLGPIRVRVATPLNKDGGATINMDVSPKEIISLVAAFKNADSFSFKDGLFTFKAQQQLGQAIGWCYGLYPTVMDGTDNYVYNHEVVHVVQNLQLMASSYEPFMKYGGEKGTFSFSGVRLQTLGVVADLSLSQFSYEDNLKEIEAFHFASASK